MTITERFMQFVSPEPNTGCWLWLGHVDRGGYGQFRVGSQTDGTRRHARAHRVAYELLRGPIPAGQTLDHLCRVRSCVNPDHLEAVSKRENILRGESFAAINASKTHCANGHEYTPENTRLWRGERYCRTCRTEQEKRRWAAK